MENVVSVIVPVYNGEKYIRRCVESILKSTYPHLEILLINDGSKDHSLEVLNQLAKEDERIRVFSKENEGIAKTRNFGLKKATGKYICFADQDDIVYPNSYQLLKDNIEKFHSDVCVGSHDYIRGKNHAKFWAAKESMVMESEELEDYIFQYSNACLNAGYMPVDRIYIFSIWSCMYQREMIEKYQIAFHSFINYEDDFLFNLDCLLHAKRISFEAESVYAWLQNIKSESHSRKYVSHYFEKYQKFYEYVTEQIMRIPSIREHIDEKRWKMCLEERDMVDTVACEANPKNPKKRGENLAYLQGLYDGLNCPFTNAYQKRDIIKTPFYLTCRCLKKGKVTLAYDLNRYFYYRFLNKITDLMRVFYYHG
ncbi:MAG: glycosyltransferase [Clostridia bacterium]|nr:glycosyltransferase [Clostridia bacterium]